MADPTSERVAGLCRLVFLFQLIAMNFTIFYLPSHRRNAPVLVLALVVATFASFLPLRKWPDIGETVSRHIAYLVGNVALGEAILFFAGADSPFFYVTVGTALLGGIVYGRRGAIVGGTLLIAGWYGIILARHGAHPQLESFQWTVDAPLLYPLAAAGGAAVRGLLDRQAQTEAALVSAERHAVASEERSRVAREMHDSLGKTLYGIALSARGLAARSRRVGGKLELEADALAAAAEVAAREARELIGDLRSDVLELPLGAAVGQHVERWSLSTGIRVEMRGDDVDLRHPGSRYELFCILKEALRNVERHAAATLVEVGLVRGAGVVALTVADDGVGIAANGDVHALEPDGHYGLIGMAERAERLAGSFEVHGRPGAGTTIRAAVPTEEHVAPSSDQEVVLR